MAAASPARSATEYGAAGAEDGDIPRALYAMTWNPASTGDWGSPQVFHVMLGMPRPPTNRTVGPSPVRRTAILTPGCAMTNSKPSFGVAPVASVIFNCNNGAARVAPVAKGRHAVAQGVA